MARTLFQIMVTAVLTRMPDYQVDRSETRFYEGSPGMFGVVRMPINFTPSDPLGIERPF